VTLLVARDLWVAPSAPGSQPVVRGVSLEVARGEWLALTGVNGGGKTSLLLALAGLWPAARGEVRFDGLPLAPDSPAARRRIGVVLQDPSSQLLQPTVAEELAFTARNLDRPEAEIARAVERWATRLNLSDVLGRDPHTLSAGRQQLVTLAAALIAAPELLLADEPGAHLDQETRARVLAAVQEERERGLAVVWATQDARELAAADRVVEVGERSDPAGRISSSNGTGGGPPAFRIRIRPPQPGEHRPITVDAARELAIGGRGVTALIGANGAGKTVLLEAAAGIRPSPQVDIQWERQPDPPALMAGQFPDLQIFEETVADEVVYAATSRGMPRAEALERAVACFDALGYAGSTFTGRRTWSLSGGEKRLVEIVATVVAPASLVLLDEPTAGLDPERKRALARIVVERSSSSPILVATQDPEWLSSLSAVIFALGQEPAFELPSTSKKTD